MCAVLAWLAWLVCADARAGGSPLAECVAKGRGAMARKDYDRARTAFDECVKLAPSDPAVLSELGWAAFLSKGGDGGQEATLQARLRPRPPPRRVEPDGHGDVGWDRARGQSRR